MALQKSVTDNKGYSADYHKIISYSYDAGADTTSVGVAIFKDQAARQSDKQPVDWKSYSFPLSGEPASREACYELLKLHEDYLGSVDC
jgi:hypothetical protein